MGGDLKNLLLLSVFLALLTGATTFFSGSATTFTLVAPQTQTAGWFSDFFGHSRINVYVWVDAASPVVQGQSTTLNWSSINGDSCTISPFGRTVGGNGSISLGPIEQDTYIYVNCVNHGPWTEGSGSASTNVQVVCPEGYTTSYDSYSLYSGKFKVRDLVCTPPAEPSLFLWADGTNLPYNSSTVIHWSTQNAANCRMTGPGADWAGASGDQSTPALTESATYTLACDSAGSQSVTINVAPSPSCSNGLDINQYSNCSCPSGQRQSGSSCVQDSCSNGLDISLYPGCSCPSGQYQRGSSCVAAPPTCTDGYCSFNGAPVSVLRGAPVTLQWTCNPSFYSSSEGGGFSTSGALQGSAVVNPTDSASYALNCIASNGARTSTSVAVTVLQPGLTISANPTRVQKGKTTTISWSAANVNANSCFVTSNPAGFSRGGVSGSETAVVNSETIFTLRCLVPAGAVSKTVTVTVVPSYEEI